MNKVMVTGAAGFIGSTLCQRLLSLGFEVLGVDSFTDYYDPQIKKRNVEALRSSGSNFTLISEDLCSIDFSSALQDVSHVFHLAAQAGVRSSWGSNFGDYVQSNISGTQRLLEAAKEERTVKKIIYSSSSSVYGDSLEYPTLEGSLPKPNSPYGVSKLAGEQLCSLYAKNFDLHTVSLRYFTVYGPKQRPDMAFSKFITSILSKTPIPIYGDGSFIRDYTYVDDIVEANVRAAFGDSSPGQIFNVCGGDQVSVMETISIIEKAVGMSAILQFHNTVPGDVKRTFGDSTLIRKSLGWVPTISISEGISNQVEHHRRTQGSL